MYACMYHVHHAKRNMHNLAINVNITSSLPLGAIAPYSFLFADALALAVASCKRQQEVPATACLTALCSCACAMGPFLICCRLETRRNKNYRPKASCKHYVLQVHTYKHTRIHACVCVCVCVFLGVRRKRLCAARAAKEGPGSISNFFVVVAKNEATIVISVGCDNDNDDGQRSTTNKQ